MGVWTTSVDEFDVTIWPPQQALVDPTALETTSQTPLFETMQLVRPNPSPVATPAVTIDGKATIPLNLLVIDFRKTELKRDGDDFEPSWALCFQTANDVLERLRSVLRAAVIRPIRLTETPARIDYLNDDGSLLPSDGHTPRAHVVGSFRFGVNLLRDDAWADAGRLGSDFAPRPWDEMLMDAADSLPRIEAAIVLAFAAVESFIDWALAELATAGGMDPPLYKWIAERGDKLELQPSPRDQYDVLLKALGGKSLKEEGGDLWPLFTQLYKVRNKSAHEGHATLDGVRVDYAKARELVTGAERIIAWVEQLLPPEKRRPVSAPTVELTFFKPLTGPGAPSREDGQPAADSVPGEVSGDPPLRPPDG
jgi:hypothetical protein